MDKSLLTAYKIIEERRIEDIDSNSYILEHIKTGARVAVLENNDDNNVFYIAFRTPPEDSTGVAHIMEHSVLCGSKQFPLKDPFIELAKGSLNTFLNAMTYPDKTVYPIASCNDKDFMNLCHVYLDAVFYPNIYKEKKIFMQEGWHYEMDDADSPLTVNGVVYNEMKGAFSSPDDILDREVFDSLFPDTPYGVESGGNPENIPDLTYDEFIDFHKRYYHPSNSYIYLYGNGDMAQRLKWMDEEYLSNFDKISIDSEIKFQNPFLNRIEITKDYPITDEEDTEDNTYFSYNAVVDTFSNIELGIAFSVIDYALCSAQGSPLKQALTDAHVGTEIYSMYNNGLLQPFYSIVSKNANYEDKAKFTEIIENVLQDIVQKGFDKNALYAGLNIMEFKYRESDFGSYPKGLILGLSCLDSWLYDDKKVFDEIECNRIFAELKKKIETNYYEEIISKYLINNNHKSIVTLVPKKGLQSIRDKELADKLEKYKNSLSEDEIKTIIDNNKELKEYQSTPDDEEAYKCIPKLKREDLDKKAKPIVNEEVTIDGIKCIFHNIFTNGILYLRILFKIDEMPKQSVYYMSLLGNILASVDTDNYSFEELGYEINKKTGSLSPSLSLYSSEFDSSKYGYLFGLNVRAMLDKTKDSFDLIKEILLNSNIEDKKRIKEIISETKSVQLASLTQSGHTTAAHRALSYISPSAAAAECISGIDFYNFLSDIDSNFDEKADEIIDNLKLILSYIVDKNKLVVDVACTSDEFENVKNYIKEFKNELSESYITLNGDKIETKLLNEGFTTSAQVQYVCRAGNYRNHGLEYNGALRVLKTILGYEYLWNEVRVKGGAYGCMSLFKRSGESYFTSYRDPNLEKTVETYEKAADFIKNFTADEDTMTKYIIGTISTIDTPLTPYSSAQRSFAFYLSGLTMDELQKERDEVLTATQDDIRSLASHVLTFIADNAFCTIGNSDTIKNNEKMFTDIKTLS